MSSYKLMSELIEKLNTATEAYNNGHPIMSDKEWDDLYFELTEKEKISGYSFPNSPTQFILSPKVDELKKVKHNHKMLSLEKTKDIYDVYDFLKGYQSVIMCKMDGLTCSLRYLNGRLVSAETRGNGIVGEDVLHNIQTMMSVPNHINYHNELIIDGEIICTYSNFNSFSSDYKNPRNFAAGSLRLLDGLEFKERKLTFVAWEVIKGLDKHISHFDTKTETWNERVFFEDDDDLNTEVSRKLHDLAKLGFTVVPHKYIFKDEFNIDRLEKEMNFLQEKAKELSYPIDGLVCKIDTIEIGKSLGETAHHFKNALAYKFYDETYSTKLVDIEYDVSRNGILTPVAVFEPIEIEGSEVSRASLHNLSVMKELLGEVVFKGQSLEIYRANMIIPQVYSAVKFEEMIEPILIGDMISLPNHCPICGDLTEVQVSDAGIETLVCSNPFCEGRLVNKLDHFCGKKGLDIKGLSISTLDKLIEWGWVNDFEDIFKLNQYEKEWKQKEGFGEKSVNNILNSIEKAKNCSLSSFLAAIGIPLIGQQVAKDLAANVIDYADFRDRVYEGWNFASIPGFGEGKMEAILNFDYTDADKIAHFLSITNEKQELNNDSLKGLTFVITGKLKNFKNRNLLKTEIENRGGKVADSVSSKTNYLINNDNTSKSAKNIKAQQLGVKIITELEFLNMIKE